MNVWAWIYTLLYEGLSGLMWQLASQRGAQLISTTGCPLISHVFVLSVFCYEQRVSWHTKASQQQHWDGEVSTYSSNMSQGRTDRSLTCETCQQTGEEARHNSPPSLRCCLPYSVAHGAPSHTGPRRNKNSKGFKCERQSFTVSVRESLPALAVSCALTMTIKDEGGDWLL